MNIDKIKAFVEALRGKEAAAVDGLLKLIKAAEGNDALNVVLEKLVPGIKGYESELEAAVTFFSNLAPEILAILGQILDLVAVIAKAVA